MSWSAHLTHTPTGLALTFATPVDRLDMTAEVAEHFASLIAIEARARVAGVVRTLAAETSLIRVQHGSHPLCCDCDPCLNGSHGYGP